MANTPIIVFLIWSSFISWQQASDTYKETRKLLTKISNVRTDDEKLAALFKIGDRRIQDLIRALDDPDPQVSLNSQRVIRYLGNQQGMKALYESYDKKEEYWISGPVPLPLTSRDYKIIDETQLSKQNESYLYALALDTTADARQRLKQMLQDSEQIDKDTYIGRALRLITLGQPEKLLRGGNDLTRIVLTNAFFIDSADRKFTTARLLALNGAKDKALVEVYINRGALAEEWYHVVIQKENTGWRFFSITQVGVS
jgi:HEAT repeat protein